MPKKKKKCTLIWLTPPKSWATLRCKTAFFRYRNRPHIEYNILDSGGLSLEKSTADSINAHMDLMSNMGEYQTKESPGRMISEHYTTMNPEKHNSSGEEGMNSLPEGE